MRDKKYNSDTSSSTSITTHDGVGASSGFSNINNVAPGFIGLDYYANQSVIPVGDKGPFPSQPKGVSIPVPISKLGPLIVTPALLEARDNGKGWENKVTYMSATMIYANTYYRPISPIDKQESFIKVSIDSNDVKDNKLLYNDNFDDKANIGLTAFATAINLSAANNLQFVNYQAWDANYTKGKNSNFVYIGQDADDKTKIRKRSVYQCILDMYEQSLFCAANFVYQIRMFQTFGHALIKKYPKYAAKITSLISELSKATYRNIVNNVSDTINNSYFNFVEWNSIVKYLAIPSSYGDGADRPLLTCKIAFSTWDELFIGLSSGTDGEIVTSTKLHLKGKDFMLSSNFISDALENFVFSADETDPIDWMKRFVLEWQPWPQRFRNTFLQLTTAIEYFLQVNGSFKWSRGWEFLPAWGASVDFDAYMYIPDVYELAATSQISYNVTSHAYVIEAWYNRNLFMPKLLLDQGYFCLWPSQGALIAQATTSSAKAVSKLTMTSIQSYHGFDQIKSPDVVYNANDNMFHVTRDPKIFPKVEDESLWVDSVSEYIPTIIYDVDKDSPVRFQRSTDLVKTSGFAQNVEAFMDIYHSLTSSPFPTATAVVQSKF